MPAPKVPPRPRVGVSKPRAEFMPSDWHTCLGILGRRQSVYDARLSHITRLRGR